MRCAFGDADLASLYLTAGDGGSTARRTSGAGFRREALFKLDEWIDAGMGLRLLRDVRATG
jgi:hypothetical protein